MNIKVLTDDKISDSDRGRIYYQTTKFLEEKFKKFGIFLSVWEMGGKPFIVYTQNETYEDVLTRKENLLEFAKKLYKIFKKGVHTEVLNFRVGGYNEDGVYDNNRLVPHEFHISYELPDESKIYNFHYNNVDHVVSIEFNINSITTRNCTFHNGDYTKYLRKELVKYLKKKFEDGSKGTVRLSISDYDI